MRKVSKSKARRYIESFGVRLNEEINKVPISHGSNLIAFSLTEEQHKQIRAGLSKWKEWNVLAVTQQCYLWEVGSSRKVIGLSSGKDKFEIFLNNSYQN